MFPSFVHLESPKSFDIMNIGNRIHEITGICVFLYYFWVPVTLLTTGRIPVRPIYDEFPSQIQKTASHGIDN